MSEFDSVDSIGSIGSTGGVGNAGSIAARANVASPGGQPQGERVQMASLSPQSDRVSLSGEARGSGAGSGASRGDSFVSSFRRSLGDSARQDGAGPRQDRADVTVGKENPSVWKALRNQGFSDREIADGKLVDRVRHMNGLRNANQVQHGQNLSLPTREGLNAGSVDGAQGVERGRRTEQPQRSEGSHGTQRAQRGEGTQATHRGQRADRAHGTERAQRTGRAGRTAETQPTPPGNAAADKQYLLSLPRKHGGTGQITGLNNSFASRSAGALRDLERMGIRPTITAGFSRGGHSPRSAHYRGQALDFTTGSYSRSTANAVRQVAARHGLSMLDEYAHPSAYATGGHFHLSGEGSGGGHRRAHRHRH